MLRNYNKFIIFLWIIISSTFLASSQELKDGSKILSRTKRSARNCRSSSIDVFFLVEVSNAIKPRDLNHVKNYISSMISKLNIGPSNVQVSLTSFGSDITNVVPLGASKDFVQHGIRSLHTERGGRILPSTAILHLANSSFPPNQGDSTGRDNVCVVIVGSPYDSRVNVTASGLHLQKHCRVVAIGIKEAASRGNKVYRVSSPPRVKNMILSGRYQDLSRRVDTTLKKICKPPLTSPVVEDFDVTDTSAGLRWKPQIDVVRYHVKLRELPSLRTVWEKRNIPSSQNQVIFTKLKEATTYSAVIRATFTERRVGPSTTILITTSIPIPKVVIDQSSVTTSSVFISWGKTTNIISNYYVSVVAIDNPDAPNQGFTSTKISTTVRNLYSGTHYKVTVATTSQGIRSAESSPAFFITVTDPPRLRVKRVELNAINMVWRKATGGLSYNLILRDVETNQQRHFNNITVTSLRITGLTASQTYGVMGYTIGENNILSAPGREVTVVTAPKNPEDFTVTSTTGTTISLRWSPQEATIGYRVLITSDDDNSYNEQVDIIDTHFTGSRMKPGYFYKFTVLSRGIKNVVDSNVIFPIVVQTVPDAPRNLEAINETPTSLEVTWDPVHGAGSYAVTAQLVENRRLVGGVIHASNTSATSALVDNLEPGALYEFKVRCEGIQGGVSQLSTPLQDSTFAAVPATPTAVAANATWISVALQPSKGAQRYILEVEPLHSDDEKGSIFIRRRELFGASVIQINRLSPGLWYNITVKSKNFFGKVNPEASLPLIEQTVPSPPNRGKFDKVQPFSLQFNWPQVKGAFSYILYVTSTDFDKEFRKKFDAEYSTNKTDYEVIDLRPGTLYQVRLQSVGNGGRKSGLGRAFHQQTLPGSPENVHKTKVTRTSIGLSWNPSKGAASYMVRIESEDGQMTDYEAQGRPSYRVTDLLPGAWYNITVFSRSRKGIMNADGSDVVRVQTVPPSPLNVQVKNPTIDGFNISWDQATGSSAYLIRAVANDDDVTINEKQIGVNGETETRINGLDSGTQYRVYVSSIGYQKQVGAESLPVSEVTLPATISRATIVEASTGSISLSWDPVKGAVKYAAKITQDLDNNVKEWEVVSESNKVDVEGLVAGAWYNVSVYSIGINNRRNMKSSIPIRTQTNPLPPSKIEVTRRTTTSATLQWKSVIGAVGYAVSANEIDNDIVSNEIETTDLKVVVKGLSPGTMYDFRVVSIGEEEGKRSVKSQAIREETDPAAPDSIIISKVKAHSVHLRWDDVKGARMYIVRMRSSSDARFVELKSQENQLVVSELESGSFYAFNIFSVGVQERINLVGSDNGTVYTAPSPPINIIAKDITTNTITLQWDSVQGAVSYRVNVIQYSSLRYAEGKQLISTSSSSLVVRNLNPGTEYGFDIRAIGKEDRISVKTEEFNDATLPNSPTTPVTRRVTTSSITIAWPSAEGALRYQVFVEREGGSGVLQYSAFSTEYLLENLDSGIKYSFHLRSIGPRDYVSNNFSGVLTQQTIPLSPPGFVATSSEVDAIGLSWDSVIGASSYELRVTSEDDDDVIMTYTGTTANVENLDSGTNYTFALRSVGEGGALKSEASLLSETTLPGTPTSVTDDGVTTNSIGLSWLSVRGAIRYKVEVHTSSGDDVKTSFTDTSATVRIKQLGAGLFYQIKVFSIGVGGRINQAGSDVTIVQTVPLPPLFQVDDVTNESISIAWEAITGAGSYLFRIQVDKTDENKYVEYKTENTNLMINSLQSGVAYLISGSTVGEDQQRRSTFYDVTDETLPNPPDYLMLIARTSNSIKISWNKPKGARSYLVYTNDNAQPTRTETNEANLTDLSPGIFYSYTVRSVGYKGRVNPNLSSSLRIQTAPLPAENFFVTTETISSISLSWDDVVGRSQFEIFVYKTENEINSASTSLMNLLTRNTKITVQDLSPGSVYRFGLRTLGQQQQTSEDNSTTIGITYPSAPTSLRKNKITTTSIMVAWQRGEGALSYEVEMTNENNVTTFSTDLPQLEVDSLTPGDVYTFSVSSVGFSGRKTRQEDEALSLQTVTNPPSLVNVDDVTTKTCVVSWGNVFGASSYVVSIYYVLDGGIGLAQRIETNLTSSAVTSLAPGIEHRVDIMSINMEKARSEKSNTIVFATLPEAVKRIDTRYVGTDTIRASWEPAEGAVSYKVNIINLDDNDDLTTVQHDTTEPKITLPNLEPGTWYKISVVSVGVLSVTNIWSNVSQTLHTVPLPPDQVVISGVTSNSFNVSWNSVNGARSYVVTVNSSKSIQNITVTSPFTHVTHLIPGMKYYVTVSSQGHQSRMSTPSLPATDSTRPDIASALQINNVTTSSVHLSWKAVRGAQRYQVYYRVKDSGGKSSFVEVTSTSADITDLNGGTWYEFVVYSVGVNNRRSEKGSDVIMVQTTPLPAENFVVTTETISSISLSWDDVVGRSQFEIFVYKTENEINSASTSLMNLLTRNTKITVQDLSPGSVYRFDLRTLGQQQQTSEDNSTTIGITYPSAPTSLRKNKITTTSIMVAWQRGEGALSYEVEMTNENNVTTFSTDLPQLEVDSLTPGDVYTFSVSSVGFSGRKTRQEDEALSLQTVTNPPSLVNVDDVTTKTCVVSWGNVFGASSYVVSIYYVLDGGIGLAQRIETNLTSSAVTSLAPGTEYRVDIVSINMEKARSEKSNTIVFATSPKAVKRIDTRYVGTDTIRASWEPAEGAVSYKVNIINLDDNDDLTTVQHDTTEPKITLPNLEPGTWYTISVVSVGVLSVTNIWSNVSQTLHTVPLPPDRVVISGVTSNSFNVSWNTANGARSYVVTVNSSKSIQNITVTSPFTHVTHLIPGMKYYVTVSSQGHQSRMSTPSLPATDSTRPDIASALQINNVTTSSVHLSWKAVRGAQRYQVYYRVKDSGGKSSFVEVTSTSADITDLNGGTWYEFVVYSVGVNNRRSEKGSDIIMVQTVPFPPNEIFINVVTTSAMNVTWNDIIGASSYRLSYSSSDSDVTNQLVTSRTHIELSNLQAGTKYVISVQSVGEEGLISKKSVDVSDTTIPNAPANVKITRVTSTSVSLSWDVKKGAENYLVLLRLREFPDARHLMEATSTSASITDLSEGTWYEFVVYSVGVNNRRSEKGSDVIMVQTIPLPPNDVVISDVTTSSMNVTWNNVIGASSYRLSYSSNDSDVTSQLVTSQTQEELSNLQAGTEYAIIVQSVGEEGLISKMSVEVSDTTIPSTPTNVRTTDTTTTTIGLVWEGRKGAVKYVISVKKVVDDSTFSLNSFSPDVTITSLTPGHTYEMVVFSVGVFERTNFDGSQPVTRQTVPSTPQGIRVSNINTSSLVVTWKPVIGASSYSVSVSSSDEDATIPAVVITTKSSVSFNSLSSGTVYSFQVIAFGEEGQESAPGKAARQTVLTAVPDRPSATEATTNSITADWFPVKGARSYIVKIINQDTNEERNISTQETDVTITSLQPGTFYGISIFSTSFDGKTNPEGSEILLKQTVTSPPENATAIKIDENEFTVTWQPVHGAFKYHIFITTNRGDFIRDTLYDSPSLTNITVRSLEPGTSYGAIISAINNDGVRSEQAFVRLTTLPSPPELPQVTERKTTLLNLSWRPMKGAVRYDVAIKNNETNQVRRFNSFAAEAQVTSLDAGTWYEIVVFSVGNSETNDRGSQPVIVQTATLPPSDVKVETDSRDLTSVVVSWRPVKGAFSYDVAVSPSDDDAFFPSVINTRRSFAEVNQLSHGTVYNIAVTAVGQQQQRSGNSDIISQTIVPAATSQPTITNVTETTISLKWNSVKGAISYLTRTTNLDNKEIEEVRSEDAEIRVKSLEPGTYYSLIVYSIGVEQMNPRGSKELRRQTVPSPPNDVGVAEETITTSSITLSWKPVKGATSYSVMYSSEEDLGKDEMTINVQESSLDVTSLLPGTSYSFYVRALGEDSDVSKRSEGVIAATNPESVKTISEEVTTTNSISITWKSSRGARKYIVNVINLDDIISTNHSTSATSFTASNLIPGTLYRFTVISVGSLNVIDVDSDVTLTVRTVPSPPRVVETTDITDDSVQMIWSSARGSSSYMVMVTWIANNQSQTRSLTTNTTSILVNDLEPGTKYGFVVKSLTSDGITSDASGLVEETTVPSIATNLVVDDVTPTSIKIKWSPVKGARRYSVYYKERHSSEAMRRTETPLAQVTVRGLNPGRWYEFVVFSIGVLNRRSKEGSDVLYQQTTPLPPDVIVANDVTTSSLVLSWNDVTGALSYVIRMVTNDNGSTDDDVTISSEESRLKVNNLIGGTEYHFYLTSVGSENQRSVESHVTTVSTLPDIPQYLDVLQQTTTSATLTWRPVKGARSYSLRVLTSSSVLTPQSGDNVVTITNLTPGEWYNVTVTSVDKFNRRSPGSSNPLRFQTVPLPPTNINVTSVSTNHVNLRWNEVRGARTYQIRYSGNGERERKMMTDVTSVAIRALSSGRLYVIKFTTVAEQNGLMSDESRGITVLTRISSPSFLQASEVSTNSVLLEWGEVEGASSYLIESSSGSANLFDQSYHANTSQIRINNLLSGALYLYRVVSIDAMGRRSLTNSDVIRVVTVTLPPRNVKVDSVTSNSFIVTWEAPTGARRYGVTVLRNKLVVRNSATSSSQMFVQGLQPGVLYTILVTSFNQNNIKSTDASTTQRTVLLPPSSIEVKSVRTNGVNLTWEEAAGASIYDVNVVRLDDPTKEFNLKVKSNDVFVRDLQPGRQYRISISAITDDGFLSPSNVTIVQQTRPSSPINVTGTPSGVKTILVNWDDVIGASYYTVYVKTSEYVIRKGIPQLDWTIGPLSTSHVVFDEVQSGINYTFQVSANGAKDVASEKSKAVTVAAFVPSPVLPTTSEPLVSIKNIEMTSFLASWPPIQHAVAYVIVIRSNVGKQEIDIKGLNNTRITVKDLFPDTDYEVTIKAVGVISNDVTEESSPPASLRTKPFPPNSPSQISVKLVRATYVIIEWALMPRAISYEVTITNTARQSTEALRITGASRANITGLTVNNVYNISITSVGLYESSPPSEKLEVRTRYPVPAMPRSSGRTLLSVNDVTYQSMRIRVQPIPHATSYDVIFRSRKAPTIRIIDVKPSIFTLVQGLQQNTVYRITYQGVGKGGDRSQESNAVVTRTQRTQLLASVPAPLVPGVPRDFQVSRLTSAEVTVRWLPAQHAISYRVIAENRRTGVTTVHNNANSPFTIRGLSISESYSVSVASVGKFFDSEYVSSIVVTIPYPSATRVNGIRASEVLGNSFKLKWHPAGFAASYTVLVAYKQKLLQEIKGITSIQYTVTNLKPGMVYNVTVQSISQDGGVIPSSEWITVRTGGRPQKPDVSFGSEALLESALESFVTLLLEMPESIVGGSNAVSTQPKNIVLNLGFRRDLEESLQEIANSLNDIIKKRSLGSSTRNFPLNPNFRQSDSFTPLFSLSSDLNNLLQSNDVTVTLSDGFAKRLTQALVVLMTSSASTSQNINPKIVMELLMPPLQRRVRALLIGNQHIVIEKGPSHNHELPLTTIVKGSTVTSSGFTVTWAGYLNSHRFNIKLEEVSSGRNVVVYDGIKPGRSASFNNLNPFTEYDVIIRPISNAGKVIKGVVGRKRVKTKKSLGPLFVANVTSIEYNSASVTWKRFPSNTPSLIFSLRKRGSVGLQQRRIIGRRESSVTFSPLSPNTAYDVIVQKINSKILFQTNFTTKKRVTASSRKADVSPGNLSDPPRGVNVTSSNSNSFALEWLPVSGPRSSAQFIRYRVRVYRAGTTSIEAYRPFERSPKVIISGLDSGSYEVTVSIYDKTSAQESPESARIRIDLKSG